MSTFVDTFDRPDSGSLGGDWATVNGNWSITSNAMRCAATQSVARSVPGTQTADMFTELVIKAITGGVHPAALTRMNEDLAFDGYMGRWQNASGGSWQIHRYVDGAATMIAALTGQAAPALPYTLRLEVEGSTIRLIVNGTQKIAFPDPTPQTAGRQGGVRVSANVDQLVDTFTLADLGTPPVDTYHAASGQWQPAETREAFAGDWS